MAIERNTFLFEFLVRMGPGGFVGAHAIDLERVSDGDEVIAERELPARPLTEAEAGTILGTENARMVEMLSAEQAATAAQRARAETAEARAEAAEGRVAELEAALAAAGAGAAMLEAQVAALQGALAPAGTGA